MNYTIKELTYDDIDEYIKVNTKAWLETYKGIISDEFLNKINHELELNITRRKNTFYLSEEQKYKKYLVSLNEKNVGMFSLGKSMIENYSEYGEILSLYLLKESQGQGLGKIIFLYALDELSKLGFKDILIGCLALNPANEFYKHMGCQLLTTRLKKIGSQELEENIYILENIEQYL